MFYYKAGTGMIDRDQGWDLPSAAPFLWLEEVHLWRTSLAVPPALLQQYRAVLSPDELKRAMQFRFARDYEHFVVAHAVLRKLLAHYLQVAPEEVLFIKNAYGKPSLPSSLNPSGLCFNLSHSHEMALFAFSYRRDLGVDVEYARKNVEYDQLARFCFSPYEQEVLLSLTGLAKHEAFYACWTRKEAYIKARGLGLSLPLDLFDVSLVPSEPAQLLASRESPSEAARWSLRVLDAGPDYAGALAVEGQGWLLRCWHWSTTDQPVI